MKYEWRDVQIIIMRHALWLVDRGGGCASLCRANLYGANLREADLRGADLYEATLYGADLYGADLRGADLRDADLRDADLRGADLYGADLRGADLRCANLCEAALGGANLRGTCLDPGAAVSPMSGCDLSLRIVDGERRWYGRRTAVSQHVGLACYSEPGEYLAGWFSVDAGTDCHPGIYLATARWLGENYSGIPTVRCYALDGEIVKTVGGKYRAKRIFVVQEEE